MRRLLLLSLAALLLRAGVPSSAQNVQGHDAHPLAQSPPQVATGARASAQENVPLEQLAADHNWPELESRLKDSVDSDTALYRGLLMNRLGQYEQSHQLLEPLIRGLAAGADRMQEKQARLALASDDYRTFHYREAAVQYEALEKCCAAMLTETEKDEIELPAKITPLLQNADAQTLESTDSFTIPLARNALGVRDAEVFVDGYPSRWIFDPASGFTLLSRSLAKRIGLKLAGADTVTVSNLNGKPVHAQVAIIPRLKVGAASFRNVPAVVLADEDLYDNPHRYQIEGVLDQPLLAVMGVITASDDDHLIVSQQPPITNGAPFFSDGNRLVAAVQSGGRQQLYAIEPGTTESILSSRFYEQHPADFAGQTPQPMHLPDLSSEIPGYTEDTLTLGFGETLATFHDIPVLVRAAGAERDRFYGTIGGNALDQLAAYTFDFRSMRFAVRVHSEQ